jgi:hypothetical protein
MQSISFIEAVQARAVRIACSPSATCGQGKGVVKAGREFLAKLPLSQFAKKRPSLFLLRLDVATQQLCDSLPKKSRSWGLARKLLNIFLRDALYTIYLTEKFNFQHAEENFELPLDSITTLQLRKAAGRGKLPPWAGVKHLTPEASAIYQEYAKNAAKTYEVTRLHLDTYWWGNRAQ